MLTNAIDIRPFLPLGKYICLITFIGILFGAPCHAADNGQTTAPSPTPLQLTEMLASKNSTQLKSARTVIAETGQSLMLAFAEIRSTGTDKQRAGAIIGLAHMPIPELTISELTNGLNDPNAVVRALSAHALAKIGAPAAPATANLLSARSDKVQTGAALALTKMGRAAVPALIDTLSSDDVFVRAKGAWLLGRLGPDAKQAIPALVRALNTEDERAMHVTAEAIDLIGADPEMLNIELLLIGANNARPVQPIGRNASPTLAAMLSRPGTPTGQAAFQTLALIGATAEPALLDVLHNGNGSQQAAAALLLSDINPDIVHTLPEELRESLAGAKRNQ